MQYLNFEDVPGYSGELTKALTKIKNSLRFNFLIGIHPQVNPLLSVFKD